MTESLPVDCVVVVAAAWDWDVSGETCDARSLRRRPADWKSEAMLIEPPDVGQT